MTETADPDRTSGPDIQERSVLVAEALRELITSVVEDFDVIDVLEGLAHHAVDLLAVDAAGVALADHNGALRLVASTSERTAIVEGTELRADDALRRHARHHQQRLGEVAADVVAGRLGHRDLTAGTSRPR